MMAAASRQPEWRLTPRLGAVPCARKVEVVKRLWNGLGLWSRRYIKLIHFFFNTLLTRKLGIPYEVIGSNIRQLTVSFSEKIAKITIVKSTVTPSAIWTLYNNSGLFRAIVIRRSYCFGGNIIAKLTMIVLVLSYVAVCACSFKRFKIAGSLAQWEVTGCAAGCHEVSTCSTKGGS